MHMRMCLTMGKVETALLFFLPLGVIPPQSDSTNDMADVDRMVNELWRLSIMGQEKKMQVSWEIK